MTTIGWSGVSTTAFSIALFAYLAAMLGYFHHLAFRRRAVVLAASAVAWAGLLAHLVSVVARGLAAGRVPWGNMYEYSSLLSLLTVAGYLGYVELRHGLRQVGGFVLMFAVVTMAIAVELLYVGPAPLVPALNSYWLKIHVVAAIVGSSLFALGGVLTILYLVQEARERRAAVAPPPIMGGAVDVEAPPDHAGSPDEPVGGGTGRRGVLPPTAALDRLAYRTIAFAFPIWTFAVIAGAIWAQRAWGRYWGWDPKETWSFVTWTIFAGYLHARSTVGWKGRRAAVLALVGFVSLLVTYYVVNLWIVGLHSYAGV
ncbi:MAG TPA: c-type cytochrome biogenesis protein CcsB [Actinomycetota bacterium]|nr:c-type cytochrome biogenesis protein CcsB [Actinomycetota bacterium]